MGDYGLAVETVGREFKVEIGSKSYTLRELYSNTDLMRQFVLQNPEDALKLYNGDKLNGKRVIGEMFLDVHGGDPNLSGTIGHLAQELERYHEPVSNHVKAGVEEFERDIFYRVERKKRLHFMPTKSRRNVRSRNIEKATRR